MSMGSTGAIHVTADMITNARSAITAYKEAVVSLKDKLTTEVTGLIPSSFSGDAADGILYFYDNVIIPSLEKDVPDFMDSLDQMVVAISDGIQSDKGIDAQLGTANKQTEAE